VSRASLQCILASLLQSPHCFRDLLVGNPTSSRVQYGLRELSQHFLYDLFTHWRLLYPSNHASLSIRAMYRTAFANDSPVSSRLTFTSCVAHFGQVT